MTSENAQKASRSSSPSWDASPRSKNLAGSLGFLLFLIVIPVLYLLPTPGGDLAASTDGFAIVGARIFDGEKVWPKADIRVQDGRIVALEEDLDLPADLEIVDGSGKTLLPGLFDAHVHAWGAARSDAVRFGVTTLLDQFTAPSEVQRARGDREAGGAQDQSDLFSAGVLATAPGGHGTQFGVPVETLEGPGEAVEWVRRRKEEGSDWIKIVVEPGRSWETLDRATVAAVVKAAHAEGLLAVAHISLLDDALAVAEMGMDGLVHVWRDRLPNPEEVQLLKDRGLFVIPTLVVMEGMVDPTPSLELAKGALGKSLATSQRLSLDTRFTPLAKIDWTVPVESVRRLAAAGVPILAGSDAPNPTTAMGLSLHREIQLLESAGLSPLESLAAATSVPARHFGVPDRGTLKEGSLADLVLVEGDPTEDLVASQQLVRVWKAGRAVTLEAPSTSTASQASAVEAAPAEALLADFEKGLVSHFGAGWSETTDQRMGGSSVVTLAAEGGVLEVDGEIRTGAMFPWAGAMVFPGQAPMAPVDFSTRKELRFRARGDGREISVMVFSGSMQGIPPTQRFQAGASWKHIVLPLEEFRGADMGQLRGIAFSAVAPTGEFHFELDDVEIR